MRTESERIYECQAKVLFKRDGLRYRQWVVRNVADAILGELKDFRCKDCYGAVRLHGKHVAHGAAPYVEHKFREDSEYCPGGKYFRQNPGRTPRISQNPVL
jgi:hypothetical protein